MQPSNWRKSPQARVKMFELPPPRFIPSPNNHRSVIDFLRFVDELRLMGFDLGRCCHHRSGKNCLFQPSHVGSAMLALLVTKKKGVSTPKTHNLWHNTIQEPHNWQKIPRETSRVGGVDLLKIATNILIFHRKYIFKSKVHFPASYVSWPECNKQRRQIIMFSGGKIVWQENVEGETWEVSSLWYLSSERWQSSRRGYDYAENLFITPLL